MTTRSPILLLLALAACNVGSQQGYEPAQPIEFSHALHAGEFRVDCQYCHTGAERSRHAGVPALSTCMNCHTQVKKDAPAIQKLAAAAAGREPLAWVRVHRFPDFAYFSHASHVTSGKLACQACHGPVETMVRLRQDQSMNMGWCLTCHLDTAAKNAAAGAPGPAPPTDCVACHM